MEKADLLALLDDDENLQDFDADASGVREALSSNKDLRKHALDVEKALTDVERESIADYVAESESLAGLHQQINDCDNVLDSMESMLRHFQSDLAAISTQVKYLQDESLSMNVKLRNRKAAESLLSSFISKIVVPPELVQTICEAEVNERYLASVIELNEKVVFSKQGSTTMTSAYSDIAPELEKLQQTSIQKIREFLLGRVATMKKKFTNTSILQQSALLKFKGLYDFVVEHAPEVADEVREAYTTTMSGVYLTKVKMYLAGLMPMRMEVCTKNDLLGADEWSAASSFFSSKPGYARGDGAYKVGDRSQILQQIGDTPLILAVQLQEVTSIHYESIFRSTSTLLLDTVTSEYEFMNNFFGDADAFDNIFGKSIFHVYENLTQELVVSWDCICCLLLISINQGQREVMDSRDLSVLDNFFHRVQVLLWGRFKAIMEAHIQSLSSFTPRATLDIHPHFIARRYAEMSASLRLLSSPVVEPMLGNLLRVLRTEVERTLVANLAKQHTSRKLQAAFLVNNYHLIVSTLSERGARGEDSGHFEQLLDAAKATFVEEQLLLEYSSMITFIKKTEPLYMDVSSKPDAERVDKMAMELLARNFYDSWKAGIQSLNREVVQSFADLKLGMDVFKQVLTQLLLYYTRFLDLAKAIHPNGPPFAQYILSIPTLMNEIKHFSRNF